MSQGDRLPHLCQSGISHPNEESTERCKHVAQLEGVQVCRGSKEAEIGELIMH
jgi:hypothetical protein